MTDIKKLEDQLVGSVMMRMLVDARHLQRMTTADVAAAMEITPDEVRAIENSHDPMAFEAMRYARAIGQRIMMNLEER